MNLVKAEATVLSSLTTTDLGCGVPSNAMASLGPLPLRPWACRPWPRHTGRCPPERLQSKGAAVVGLALRKLLRRAGARGEEGDGRPGNGVFCTLDGAR
jgi:hypothetical protein